MPYELIFTSVPHGIIPGRTGYCTAAHTEGIPEELRDALESVGVYHHIGAPNSPDNPVVYSHRHLNIRHKSYHVVSVIRDSGLDHTNRSNYLAHHIAFDSAEVGQYANPAAILLNWDWSDNWGDNPPQLLDPRRLDGLRSIPRHNQAKAQLWEQMTGDAASAAKLMSHSPAEHFNWQVDKGREKTAVHLFAEALQLADPAGQATEPAWGYTFTTFLQEKEDPSTFCWCGCIPGTASYQALQHQGGSIQSLATILPPPQGDPRAEFARTGQPQAAAKAPAPGQQGPPPKRPDKNTAATAKVAVTLDEMMQGTTAGSEAPKATRREKRTVKKQGAGSSRNKVVVGAIAACASLLVLWLLSGLIGGDDKPNPPFVAKKVPGDNGKNPKPPTTNSTNPDGGGNGNPPKPNGGGNGNPATTTVMLDKLQGKKIYITFANPQQEVGGLNSLVEDDPLLKLSNALKAHREKSPNTDYEAAQFSVGKINGTPSPIKVDGSSFRLGDRMVMSQNTGVQALTVPYAPYAIKPGLLHVFPKAGVEPKPFQEFVILVTGGNDGTMKLSKDNLKFDDNQKTVTINKAVEEEINKMLSSATDLGINLTPVLGANDGTPNLEVDFKPYAQQQILALDRQVKNIENRKELCNHAINAFKELKPKYEKFAKDNAALAGLKMNRKALEKAILEFLEGFKPPLPLGRNVFYPFSWLIKWQGKDIVIQNKLNEKFAGKQWLDLTIDEASEIGRNVKPAGKAGKWRNNILPLYEKFDASRKAANNSQVIEATLSKGINPIKQTLLGHVTRLRLSNQDQFSQGIALAAQYCIDAPTAEKYLKAYNKELSRLEGFDLEKEKTKWSGDGEWNKLKKTPIILYLNGGHAPFIKFE